MAVELDRRGRAHGVRGFSLEPGSIITPLQRHLSREWMVEQGWIDTDGNGVDPDFKTTEQGAATATWAATSPLLADTGGVFCADCDVAASDGVAPWAVDPGEAERLWELSAELTGMDTGTA
jgi:NAD(P)-dependent dehydrogenase (short-subunit alcohol dehydrogenase family)